MNIVAVVGARPQFVKAAAVSRALRAQHHEYLVHTGQHYDYGMSQVFFDELGIPEPDINLGVGSASHGVQTGRMLAEIESVLLEQAPDWVLVYGDTNSTLAGALAAAKLHIPVAHVEAGLRSYNRAMPEEINRVLTDHVSHLLLCPTERAVENLDREGITEGVHRTGDVMVDAVLYYAGTAAARTSILEDLGVEPGAYTLATVHRPRNTDDAARLRAIIRAFGELASPLVFPAHPRTLKALEQAGVTLPPNVRLEEPVGYLEMIQLERHAERIITDSGGVQKEAYVLRVPCVTLREETEWVETVAAGWNVLVGAETAAILDAVRTWEPPADHPDLYGDGDAAHHIVSLLSSEGLQL